MELGILVVLFLVNLPVYNWLHRLLFRNDQEFRQSMRYILTPDLISLFRGRFWQDLRGETRLKLFFFLCIAVTFIEFALVHRLLRWLTGESG
ncbi:hypothetical protein J31TS4_26520 [Paenibacillus sp. J31TS4]|uniref:hypothetical protein n=1 Tax=Paenibacillus sp. J31TS4 TaxID=2807195 RepID=UPI001B0ED55A|nr:hypothetical protein [Paenibacillus sp. J31TS4]GIP39372.1 hypothetical protein J31TS4_26520 [Paenibacillus sp. J31TS4]